MILLTFITAFFVIKMIRAVLRSVIIVSRANLALKEVLLSVVDILLWVMAVAIIMQQLGLTQISLALSSSVLIAGVAVSIGTSTLLQDLAAGIFLAKDPDFDVGKTIRINDVEGVIERMDARKVRLRSKDGSVHVFPNSFVDKAAWIIPVSKMKK